MKRGMDNSPDKGPAMKRSKSSSGSGVSSTSISTATSIVSTLTSTLDISAASNTSTTEKMDVDANDDAGWTKIQKRKSKKEKKRAEAQGSVANSNNTTKEGKTPKSAYTGPRFMYSNHEILKRNHAIGIEEVRDLALHLLTPHPPPNWLKIENGNLIQRVVVLMVPGLTNDLLGIQAIPTKATTNPNLPLSIPLLGPGSDSTASSIPFIPQTFSHACPTRAPGDQYRMHSVLSNFFSVTVGGEEKRRREREKAKAGAAKPKSDPAQYLLTLEQMVENDYPVPSYMAEVFEKPEGWVEVPEPRKSTKGEQRIYAIDCEMCLTSEGKELARVCLIDFHSGVVVYDQLVKPGREVVDYLTRFSGITPGHLEHVTTTLADVQAHLLNLLTPSKLPPNPFSSKKESSKTGEEHDEEDDEEGLPPTPILLGHSLESDLRALKLCHPLCMDTALMYHHPRGRPLKPGLAWLTKKWCNREIQARGEGGHDPEEDARACLDLLKRKLEEGPGFGEFKTDQESIFEKMSRSARRTSSSSLGGQGTVRSAVVDYGNPSNMHGSKATSAVPCKNDEEVVDGILGALGTHDFVFGRLMGVADLLGWITQRNTITSEPAPPPAEPTKEQLITALKQLNTNLTKIHATLPSRTAFILFTGHSDPRKMTQLGTRKNAFEAALRNGKTPEVLKDPSYPGGPLTWTMADARELEEAVEVTKRGLLFLGVKA